MPTSFFGLRPTNEAIKWMRLNSQLKLIQGPFEKVANFSNVKCEVQVHVRF
jgi:hypothetical protein